MVHPILVPQTAELTDWTKNSVRLTACQARRFPLLLTGDAAEEVGAEDLHLARLGRHGHVRSGVSARLLAIQTGFDRSVVVLNFSA